MGRTLLMLLLVSVVTTEKLSKSTGDDEITKEDKPLIRQERATDYCGHVFVTTELIIKPNTYIGKSGLRPGDTIRCKNKCQSSSFHRDQEGLIEDAQNGCQYFQRGRLLAYVKVSGTSGPKFYSCNWCQASYCDPFTSKNCANNVGCVKYTDVCNGVIDCEDASDEANCYVNSTASLYNNHFGLVLVEHVGLNAMICTDNDAWTSRESGVICRQLGFRDGSVLHYNRTGVYPPLWLTNMKCRGMENSIFQCSYTRGECTEKRPAAVSCF